MHDASTSSNYESYHHLYVLSCHARESLAFLSDQHLKQSIVGHNDAGELGAVLAKVLFSTSGVIDARVAALLGALAYWSHQLKEDAIASLPLSHVFTVHDAKEARHSDNNLYMEYVLNQVRQLIKMLRLPTVQALWLHPSLPLAPDDLVDEAAGGTPYPTSYQSLLDELLVEWDRHYHLTQLQALVSSQQYNGDGSFAIFFDTIGTTWGQDRLQEVSVPHVKAFFPTIIPVSVLVVIDQSILSYYGGDPLTVALKVKRNIELWDAPLTAYFGIFLNVRTVAYINQTDYIEPTDIKTWCYDPLNSLFCVDYVSEQKTDLEQTREYYMTHDQVKMLIQNSDGWNPTVGAKQKYDMLIILSRYARYYGDAGRPISGIAGLGLNWMFMALDHPFWLPQHLFLHELAHVYGADHPALEYIGQTSVGSVPDGPDDNTMAASAIIEHLIINSNADENNNEDWYFKDNTDVEFATGSLLSYFDNYLMSRGLRALWGSYTEGNIITATMRDKNNNLVTVYYDEDGSMGDFDSIDGLYPVVVVFYPKGQLESILESYFLIDWHNWDVIKQSVSKFASSDPDDDGLTNSYEWQIGTDPITNDTDGDLLSDGFEDAASSRYFITFDPLNPDTDGNGVLDGQEDHDNDGLPACLEAQVGTNLRDSDTDNDGLPDGWEYFNGLDPTNRLDADDDNDNDGLDNIAEYQHGTNPWDADTDDDGLTDGNEVNGLVFCTTTYKTNPTDPDSDNDGLIDGQERQHCTNPHDANTDDDYLLDGVEVAYGYDPTNPSDPIILSWLTPTSLSADDVKDRVTVSVRRQAKISSFTVTLKLYDLSAGWRTMGTKTVTTSGSTGTVSVTFTITRGGYYTQAQVLVKAYNSGGLLLGQRRSPTYSIKLYVDEGTISPF